jgi:hypothetical protein
MATLPNARLASTPPPVNVQDPPGAAPYSDAPAKLPPEMAAAARRHARRLARKYEHLFLAEPKLKQRYAAAILKELPPRPRPPGQPARELITKAESLSRRFRREHPEDNPKQHWERVCAAVFPDWPQRTPQARRQDKRVLANQIRSRRNARRQRLQRRRREKAAKQSQPK